MTLARAAVEIESEYCVERRDGFGVLLRYHPGKIGAHHTSTTPQASDSDRIAVLKAGKAVAVIAIIVDHIEISNLGRDRLDAALRCIERALRLERCRTDLSGQPAGAKL